MLKSHGIKIATYSNSEEIFIIKMEKQVIKMYENDYNIGSIIRGLFYIEFYF